MYESRPGELMNEDDGIGDLPGVLPRRSDDGTSYATSNGDGTALMWAHAFGVVLRNTADGVPRPSGTGARRPETGVSAENGRNELVGVEERGM